MAVVCSFLISAQEVAGYQITDVSYQIDGITREYPLRQAVPVDTNTIFQDMADLTEYIGDLIKRLENQRVLESVEIVTDFGVPGPDFLVPVLLTIKTVDTWNIIGLPYPKYDSNDGFQFKLKLKDYNFLGSMHVMNADVIYELDTQGESQFATNFDFSIPFSVAGYDMNLKNDFNMTIPIGEVPEYTFKMGTDISIPFSIASLVIGLDESLHINDRNSTEMYSDDPVYFATTFQGYMPFVAYTFDFFGDLIWSPYASVTMNLDPDGIDHPDLRGPAYSWGHSVSVGRVDWYGNFRRGFSFDVGNSWSWNGYTRDPVGTTIDTTIKAYYSAYDFFGVSSRIKGFYNFREAVSEDRGSVLRGILDDRIETDTAVSFNIDFPVKIMHVNFPEITGVKWTRFVSFDMHASPFLDISLVHDQKTGRYFNPKDGWYAAGLEVIVFPMKMRSIYGRISLGFDIAELISNDFNFSARAVRDGDDIKELFIGIGLEY